MPCYHPIPAWRAASLNPNGKRNIVFTPREGFRELTVPCGRCIGCRILRAQDWAIRCVHESKMHQFNRFVTLTYRPEALPPGGTLRPRDFVLFMKKLRKAYGNGIRFYQVGEYGANLKRPHHHVLLFGMRFRDERLFRRGSKPQWSSDHLDQLWGNGFTSISEVNYSTAMYCSKYATKVIRGAPAADHYGGKLPEYATMSRRPGIGTSWYQKWKKDAFPSDFIIVNGRKFKPPRAYLLRYEKENPEGYETLKRERKRAGRTNPDNAPRALIRRGDFQDVRTKQLNQERSYEK